MLDKLASLENRYDELEHLMADPDIAGEYARLQNVF